MPLYIGLRLHSTLCTFRCCTGKCVCLDSLVPKALLELPPAPVFSHVLRLPVWVVQSFLESWPPDPEPSGPNWLQHFFSVDQAFSTRISGLGALLLMLTLMLLLERSQLLQNRHAGMVPVLCAQGRLQSLVHLLFVKCVVICSQPSVFRLCRSWIILSLTKCSSLIYIVP